MLKKLGLICALLGYSTVVSAETSQINWTDLIDQSKQAFEDPYAELDYEQLSEVVQVARLQQILAETGLSEAARVDAAEKLNASRNLLAEQDIDVDWLISQRWIVAERREAAAVSANPAIDGRDVTLAGFAIPAPPDPDGARVVYLVPERGMCSHMPPPAPNQMVRVRLNDEDWTPRMMHEPVRLSGQLDIEWSDDSIYVVDGLVPMRASFALEANEIERLAGAQADPPLHQQSGGFAERLRASGHLRSTPSD